MSFCSFFLGGVTGVFFTDKPLSDLFSKFRPATSPFRRTQTLCSYLITLHNHRLRLSLLFVTFCACLLRRQQDGRIINSEGLTFDLCVKSLGALVAQVPHGFHLKPPLGVFKCSALDRRCDGNVLRLWAWRLTQESKASLTCTHTGAFRHGSHHMIFLKLGLE